MATYNGERFLREQLESLYSQTMPPYEVFVSDDHSTDETHKILEEFNKTHGLKYVVNENPLGVNKNFEQAIRSCTGDYIIICDQDDLWFSDKIQKSFEKLREIENGKPALVSSQWFKINSEGKILSKRRKIRKDTYPKVLRNLGYKGNYTIIMFLTMYILFKISNPQKSIIKQ